MHTTNWLKNNTPQHNTHSIQSPERARSDEAFGSGGSHKRLWACRHHWTGRRRPVCVDKFRVFRPAFPQAHQV